jgi:EAL domain-containing protein (putative c-di-GMP-specific phosphodiesterase class I)
LLISVRLYAQMYLSRFTELNNEHPIISINFSIRQLEQSNLIGDLLKRLDNFGIQRDKIEIEVTESTIMRQTVNVLSNIQDIKVSGIKLVIDDFGAGYSSFGYLNSLPIYKIKIDRTFLIDVPNSVNNCAIIKAMISLAKNLCLKVVAEGVETKEQLDFLREQECDYAQGFYLAKPQPWSNIIAIPQQTAF